MSSSSEANRKPFIGVLCFLNENPTRSEELETVLRNFEKELVWRGLAVDLKLIFEKDGDKDMKVALQSAIKSMMAKRVVRANHAIPKLILVSFNHFCFEEGRELTKDLRQKHNPADFWFSVAMAKENRWAISVTGKDWGEMESVPPDHVAKFLIHNLMMSLTQFLNIGTGRPKMKGPPILVISRQPPCYELGDSSLGDMLEVSLNSSDIPTTVFRVQSLLLFPEYVEELQGLAKEAGFPSTDMVQGCRRYLQKFLANEINSDPLVRDYRVLIIDCVNDLYVDIEEMFKFCKMNNVSVYVMEIAPFATPQEAITCMTWVVRQEIFEKRDSYGAEFFYTQASLLKKLDMINKTGVVDDIGSALKCVKIDVGNSTSSRSFDTISGTDSRLSSCSSCVNNVGHHNSPGSP